VAIRICEEIISIDPSVVKAHCNLGFILNKTERYREAIASLDRAIAISPQFAEAHLNRGNALTGLGQAEDALASYDKALAINPDYTEAINGRGAALVDLKRAHEALACYERAIALMPDNAATRLNHGIAALLIGDFAAGWPGYEYRLDEKNGVWRKFMAHCPIWGGESIERRRLIVYEEQGLGDIIQFSRYFDRLLQMGADVTFFVRPNMHRLLRRLRTTVRLVEKQPLGEKFHTQCALMSLPAAFRTTIDTIPSDVPYLTAEDALVDRWWQQIGRQGLKIGIAWQGNPAGRIDRGRSIPLRCFRSLAALPGVRLISLQKTHGLDQLADLPAGMHVETLGAEFDSGPDAFIDSAAVIARLDLIVTSDTSIAHLAGALGRPVWLGLKWAPEWRWLLDRSDSPWYPTMKLYRQPKSDDWDSVFSAMAAALTQLRQMPT